MDGQHTCIQEGVIKNMGDQIEKIMLYDRQDYGVIKELSKTIELFTKKSEEQSTALAEQSKALIEVSKTLDKVNTNLDRLSKESEDIRLKVERLENKIQKVEEIRKLGMWPKIKEFAWKQLLPGGIIGAVLTTLALSLGKSFGWF